MGNSCNSLVQILYMDYGFHMYAQRLITDNPIFYFREDLSKFNARSAPQKRHASNSSV